MVKLVIEEFSGKPGVRGDWWQGSKGEYWAPGRFPEHPEGQLIVKAHPKAIPYLLAHELSHHWEYTHGLVQPNDVDWAAGSVLEEVKSLLREYVAEYRAKRLLAGKGEYGPKYGRRGAPLRDLAQVAIDLGFSVDQRKQLRDLAKRIAATG